MEDVDSNDDFGRELEQSRSFMQLNEPGGTTGGRSGNAKQVVFDQNPEKRVTQAGTRNDTGRFSRQSLNRSSSRGKLNNVFYDDEFQQDSSLIRSGYTVQPSLIDRSS